MVDLVEYAESELKLAGYFGDEAELDGEGILDAVAFVAGQRWPDEDLLRVLEIMDKLLRGKSLTELPTPTPAPSPTDDVDWVDYKVGDERIRPGHRARVKPDAYDKGSAEEVNGRTGTFAGARSGYVYIKYDGDHDSAGAPHRPELIEVEATP